MFDPSRDSFKVSSGAGATSVRHLPGRSAKVALGFSCLLSTMEGLGILSRAISQTHSPKQEEYSRSTLLLLYVTVYFNGERRNSFT